MKLYTDEKGNILEINSTYDTSLIEHEIDRTLVFNNKSDEEILLYKYIPDNKGFSLIQKKDYAEKIIDIKIKKLQDVIIQQEEIIATLLLEGVGTNA